MITAEGLTKRYGDTVALAGIDLEVPKGSVLGVLGPNGAGKTTAVRILTTLTIPDAGRARRGDRGGRRPPPHRRGGPGRHPRRAAHRSPEPRHGRRAQQAGPAPVPGPRHRAARAVRAHPCR